MNAWEKSRNLRSSLYCAIIIGILIGSFVFSVSAHSPSSMDVKYSKDLERLSLEITHQVSDLNTHYVNNIVVTINGQTAIDEDYTSQPEVKFPLVFENLSAEIDDVISVVASCNQGGAISEELTVTEGSSQTGSDSTPGFEFVFILCSLASIILYLKRKR